MDGYLLWLVAPGYCFGLPTFDVGVDGVDFTLLVLDASCQLLPLSFVFDLVLLVLPEDLLVLLASDDPSLLDLMQLIQQTRVVLPCCSQLGL